MGETSSKSSSKKKTVKFFIDECLPYKIAVALAEVGYSITSWDVEFNHQQGVKDPQVIQYLGEQSLTWITKDDAAKKEHAPIIRTAGINVVWIKGLDRPSAGAEHRTPLLKELHKMLTLQLDEIEKRIIESDKPIFFTLILTNDGKTRLNQTTLEQYFT